MKENARRNWRRRKRQATQLAKREYFRRKKQPHNDEVEIVRAN